MFEEGELTDEAISEFNRCFRRTDEDIAKYKKYGVSNPYRVKDETDEFIWCQNSNDGCCYMMTCNCKEEKPWFTGKCAICNVRINKKTEAMRFPLWNGGFTGCYCHDHFKRESDCEMKMLCDIIEMLSQVWKIEEDDEIEI